MVVVQCEECSETVWEGVVGWRGEWVPVGTGVPTWWEGFVGVGEGDKMINDGIQKQRRCHTGITESEGRWRGHAGCGREGVPNTRSMVEVLGSRVVGVRGQWGCPDEWGGLGSQ